MTTGFPQIMVRALQTLNRLKEDFTWVLAGNICYSACQWGIVVALAKLGNARQVGEYALGVAVSAPIILFASLQLRALLVSESNKTFTFGHYLAFRLVSLGAALVVVAAVAAGTQPDWRMAGIVMVVGFAQALEYLGDNYYGYMQKYERMDRISISLLLKGPLSLALLCGAMYLKNSVIWAVSGLALGRVVILFAWDMRLGFRKPGGSDAAGEDSVRLVWHSREMLSLLRTALPLGFILMLVSLNSNMPRYFLEAHSGSTELGFYSALAALITAGNVVISAFGQSIFIPVARASATFDYAKLRGYALLVVAIGGALGALGLLTAALFGQYILSHIFRPEYGEHARELVRLAIAGSIAFMGSGLGYVVTAARRLIPQIPVLAASCLASGAISAWSVTRYGLMGAANGFLGAAIVQFAGMAVLVWRIDVQFRAAKPSPARPAVSKASLAVGRVLADQEGVQ